MVNMFKRVPRVLIAAGGSGGHLFPAQAVADSLQKRGIEICFAGAGLSNSPFFTRKFNYLDVESPKPVWSPKGFIRLFGGWWRGSRHALELLGSYRPDIVLGFGSFHTASTLLATVWQRVPLLLHEANAKPGKVVRLFKPLARETGVHFAALTQKRAFGKCVWTRLPLKWGKSSENIPERAALLSAFGLREGLQTLLIFGGSQGARFLNERVPEALASCGRVSRCVQVIHLAGQGGDLSAIKALYQKEGIGACVRTFEEKMHWAWAIADVAVARAGSSTLAEMAHFKTPAILIPYPGAGNHQLCNAQAAASETGGALCIPQSAATTVGLGAALETLLSPSSLSKAKLLAGLKVHSKRDTPPEIDTWVFKHLQEIVR